MPLPRAGAYMLRSFFLLLLLGINTPAWSMPTDGFVATAPGTRRAYAVEWIPGDIFIYDYAGARMNHEYTLRHVLADAVTVNGDRTTVVKDVPEGYAEYWQFGAGARLVRIDEGDYDDEFGIGAFNRQNLYTPAIPVV